MTILTRQLAALLAMFALALIAGTLLGLNLHRWMGDGHLRTATSTSSASATMTPDEPPPPPPPPSGRDRESWLTRELNLRSDQQKAMSEIWSDLNRQIGMEDREGRRALQKERDEAIKQLIPAERLTQWQAIQSDYASKVSQWESRRRAAFDQAVEKTKAILDATQRQKYEELLARRHAWGRNREKPPTTAADSQERSE